MEVVKIIWENYEQICKENFEIINKKEISKMPLKVYAIASFKVISEIIGIMVYILNIFSENVTMIINNLIPQFIKILKILEKNPFEKKEYNPAKKIQIGLYEDYLYCLTKIEYFLAFLMKVDQNIQTNLIRYGDDIVKGLIHILDNLQKNNFHTRKEVLAITKSMIKPFGQNFFEKCDYFRNDENLLGKNPLAHDALYMEISKINLTLIETISDKLNFLEKASFVKEFIMKINNFKIGYEFKFYYFHYIHSLIISMSASVQQDPHNIVNWEMIINLNNSILRETTYFLETLQKIFNKVENYFVIDPTEKKKRTEYVEKYFFENSNPGKESELKPDLNAIGQSNTFKIYEIIISNEYEKYINIEEPKYLHEILRQIIQIVKFCVNQIQNEFSGHFNQQMEYQQKMNMMNNQGNNNQGILN